MRRHAWALALVVAAVATAEANVPTTVHFTARLVDEKSESPLEGSHIAVFALFDADAAGNSVWNESHDVTPEDGMIYVELGEKTALDAKVFDDKKLWLQVSLDGNVMDPRIPLASVPYAIRASSAGTADNADKVGGLGLDGLQQKVTGTCNTGQYLRGINTDGSVDCAPDVAGAGDITDVIAGSGLMGGAATGAATLALISCGMNQILKWNGAAWACAADADSGDVTGITVSGGLVGGGTSGDISISLPGTCSVGQVLKWNGSVWGCAGDLDTNSGGTITGVTIGAAGGLIGGGTSGSVSLSLPNTCTSGQLLKWSGSTWACSNDFDTNSGGTITGVTAGVGLTGGGSSGNVGLAVGQGIGIVVQGTTVGLDTAYTDTRYLMVSGGTITGPVDMTGHVLSNRGCPANFTLVRPGLCVEASDQCCYNFSLAANRCAAAGSHLCSSAEVRAAMLSGIALGGGLGQDWIADQDADDSALYVNNAGDTTNPDGARATTTSQWSRCCMTVE